MRPLWREICPTLMSYLDAPFAMDADAPSTAEDYYPWAEFEKLNFWDANRTGAILATIDYILTHPEFSLVDFLDARAGIFDEAQFRRTLEIAREVAFPDAAPSDLSSFDPSGLFDKTPEMWPPRRT